MNRPLCVLFAVLMLATQGVAVAAPSRVEEIKFKGAEGSTLAGSLAFPQGKGPFPAIVLLGGSERLGRTAIYNWVGGDALVSDGLAVFAFDSPGTGDSEGDRWRRTEKQRTDDAMAAVVALKDLDMIDGERIGLFGASEGGAVVFRAAARPGGVAFGVAVSAPAVPNYKHMESITRTLCSQSGLEGTELEKLVMFNLLTGELVRGWNRADLEELNERAAGWDSPAWGRVISLLQERDTRGPDATQQAFIAIAGQWESAPWFKKNKLLRDIQRHQVEALGSNPSDGARASGDPDSARTHVAFASAVWARLASSDTPLAMLTTRDPSRDEDPVAYLKKVRCPLLCIYGEKDAEMAAYPGIVRGALATSGHRDAAVKVLAGAGHQLEVTDGQRTIRHPEFQGLLLDWIRERLP